MAGGWHQVVFKFPSNPNCSVTLCSQLLRSAPCWEPSTGCFCVSSYDVWVPSTSKMCVYRRRKSYSPVFLPFQHFMLTIKYKQALQLQLLPSMQSGRADNQICCQPSTQRLLYSPQSKTVSYEMCTEELISIKLSKPKAHDQHQDLTCLREVSFPYDHLNLYKEGSLFLG